mgnify:CR=1 FL=1|jgi:hypothetical protein
MAKNEKELQREKLAQDIRNYLSRGGVIRTYAHGESAVEARKDNAIWEKKLRVLPDKRKTK